VTASIVSSLPVALVGGIAAGLLLLEGELLLARELLLVAAGRLGLDGLMDGLPSRC